MPQYQNIHNHPVLLTGPDGQVIKVNSREIVNLPDFFEKYRERGFIKALTEKQGELPRKSAAVIPQVSSKRTQPAESHRRVPQKRIIQQPPKTLIRQTLPPSVTKPLIVGKQLTIPANKIYDNAKLISKYLISNNVAVGILSYNRKDSLERCINSIKRYTDLSRTTVFISDDASDDHSLNQYLDELAKDNKIVVLRNTKRLGIAGNTNRLLRCLQRFRYCFLLNDDIEIMAKNWEQAYINAMLESGYAHLIHNEPGVYGAKSGENVRIGGADLNITRERPQGAFLAFNSELIRKIGVFDCAYGLYGMEHVDWSTRVSEFGLQPPGYYDLKNSGEYVKLHNDVSAVADRQNLLRQAKELFANRQAKFIPFDQDSILPKISYVIPYREQERNSSLKTVINNIRAQRFPEIEIILVEEDHETRVIKEEVMPINYFKTLLNSQHLFNKSMAFNLGVSKANHEFIILHDADMLVSYDYTSEVYDILKRYESCHLGATVLYANNVSTVAINNTGEVLNPTMERVVGYYEGGSLACRKETYWSIGGFNEDFWGYGCEDCEFYFRLSKLSKFISDRHHDLLHLHHGRAGGWDQHHQDNKALDKKLAQIPLEKRREQLRIRLKGAGYI